MIFTSDCAAQANCIYLETYICPFSVASKRFTHYIDGRVIGLLAVIAANVMRRGFALGFHSWTIVRTGLMFDLNRFGAVVRWLGAVRKRRGLCGCIRGEDRGTYDIGAAALIA